MRFRVHGLHAGEANLLSRNITYHFLDSEKGADCCALIQEAFSIFAKPMRPDIHEKMELIEKPTRSWQVDFLPQATSATAAGQRGEHSQSQHHLPIPTPRTSFALLATALTHSPLFGIPVPCVDVKKMDLTEKPTRSWQVDFLPQARSTIPSPPA